MSTARLRPLPSPTFCRVALALALALLGAREARASITDVSILLDSGAAIPSNNVLDQPPLSAKKSAYATLALGLHVAPGVLPEFQLGLRTLTVGRLNPNGSGELFRHRSTLLRLGVRYIWRMNRFEPHIGFSGGVGLGKGLPSDTGSFPIRPVASVAATVAAHVYINCYFRLGASVSHELLGTQHLWLVGGNLRVNFGGLGVVSRAPYCETN